MTWRNQHTKHVREGDFHFKINRERRTMKGLSDADLLQMLANGHTVAGVARTLDVSRHRVQNRLCGLYKVMGVTTAAGAVAEGYRLGMLKTGGE